MTVQEERLQALYAKLPTIRCKGLCQECCGPIGMSQSEFKVIHALVGDRIRPTSLGVKGVGIIGKNLTCPLLRAGRCSVYDSRPMICRIWGMMKEMRCPHGCQPTRWMTSDETNEFLTAAEAIK